jgi:hypothetical protein
MVPAVLLVLAPMLLMVSKFAASLAAASLLLYRKPNPHRVASFLKGPFKALSTALAVWRQAL